MGSEQARITKRWSLRWPPGGTGKIARNRRKLIPRLVQVNAAMADIWSYLGKKAEAQR